jgi:hypothetical protein
LIGDILAQQQKSKAQQKFEKEAELLKQNLLRRKQQKAKTQGTKATLEESLLPEKPC